MKSVLLVMVLATMALCAPPAAASLLDGKTIGTVFLYPDLATVYPIGGGPVTSVVGPGIELTTIPGPPYIASIDFSDRAIRLEFTYTAIASIAEFNGWRFFDVFSAIDPITSATLDTNLSLLPGTGLTFDANNVWLNIAGAAYSPGKYAQINLNPSSIPEPGSLVLLGLGLAALAAWKRRK